MIDENTGSSSEHAALFFNGLPNATFFGSDSAWYTSTNQEIPLYDGTTMQINTAFIKDSMDKIYKNTSIKPNIQTVSRINTKKSTRYS